MAAQHSHDLVRFIGCIFRLRREGLRSSEFHAVDKRIPVPPGMYKNPANNEINSLWNGAGFFSINSMPPWAYIYTIWCIQNDDCHLRVWNTKKLLPFERGYENSTETIHSTLNSHSSSNRIKLGGGSREAGSPYWTWSSLKPKKASTIGDNSNELLYPVWYPFSMVTKSKHQLVEIRISIGWGPGDLPLPSSVFMAPVLWRWSLHFRNRLYLEIWSERLQANEANMEEFHNLDMIISKVQGSVYWVAVFYCISFDAILYLGHFDEWHTPIRFKFPHRSNLLIAEGLCQFGEDFSELHQKRDGNYCCISWTNNSKTHQQKINL